VRQNYASQDRRTILPIRASLFKQTMIEALVNESSSRIELGLDSPLGGALSFNVCRTWPAILSNHMNFVRLSCAH
jgi:hypothetical protein